MERLMRFFFALTGSLRCYGICWHKTGYARSPTPSRSRLINGRSDRIKYDATKVMYCHRRNVSVNRASQCSRVALPLDGWMVMLE
uniref:Putative secreted protein n=1 Tax=Anopheles marajoara TaxID=58244 RepID=A0A2M4CAT5_9DIPT